MEKRVTVIKITIKYPIKRYPQSLNRSIDQSKQRYLFEVHSLGGISNLVILFGHADAFNKAAKLFDISVCDTRKRRAAR